MAVTDTAPEGTLFGHPRGLTWLFTTEMTERFSYYGMRALLPIYLVNFLLLPGRAEHVIGYSTMKGFYEWMRGPLGVQAYESMIYASYTGLVYFTPLIGGYLADRYFGRRYTVIVGALLMAAGHFLMAFESYLFIALGFLVLGNGAFKPNISTQVGNLYKAGDSRIDRAYSIFYVGINTGAALGTFICGTLGEEVAWHYGFGAAGVVLLLGTLVYAFALNTLPRDEPTRNKSAPSDAISLKFTRRDWSAVATLISLFVPCILFWATYEQSGNTIEFWTQDFTNRTIALGSWQFEIPVTAFQWVNPVMIFAFTPLVIGVWNRQRARGRESSVIQKMVIGCLLVAASYAVLALAAYLAGPGGKSHWLWTILYFAVLTTGELYFSPVGLSLYAKTAPVRIGSLMMGVWLATSFPGNFLAGYLGSYWSEMDKQRFFLMIGGIIGAAAVVIWLFDRPVRWLLQSALAEQRRVSAQGEMSMVQDLT
jgi:POT family proton-dependent oligopeptide transporter